MPAGYLYNLSETILNIAEDSLDVSRTGNPNPHRVFVAWATPPADQCCEGGGQLTVHMAAFNEDGLGMEPNLTKQRCSIRWTGRFLVTLYRCHPVAKGIEAPAAETLDIAAEKLFKDLWSLVDGLTENWQSIVDDGCAQVEMGSVKLLSPQGGCAGVQVEILVKLEDSTPLGS